MREKPLILIVDDEQDIRQMVKIKLENSDFEVNEAANGFAGINSAVQLKPDFILLDIRMPEMDGVEVLLKLKENPETRNIKIFLFTGQGDSNEKVVELNRRFAQESGAVDFIRKETDLDVLVEIFKKAVADAKKAEELKNKTVV